MEDKKTKTSRVLSVYHLFLHCEEVSCQEFTLNFGVSQRTAFRDIRLLQQAGIPDRTRQRDFKGLEQLGYEVWYEREFENGSGWWHYEVPNAYGFATIPGMKQKYVESVQ